MKSLLTFLLLSIFTINAMLACDPYFAALCQTSNQTRFADMNMFAATIASKSDQSVELNILSNIRGDESRNLITVWDGTEVRSDPNDDCDYYGSGFTKKYGEIGDTIFCIVALIDEIENEWEVIGDYRKPETDGSYNVSFTRVENGLVSNFDNISNAVIPFAEFFANPCGVVYGCTAPDACNYRSAAQSDDGSCYFDCEKPEINCPQRDIYLCESTKVPRALTLAEFDITDNVTPANDINFSFRDDVSHFSQYSIYSYTYYFSDADGNRVQCGQRYYMPAKIAVPPAIDSTINICQGEEAIVLVKSYFDNYFFYADNNGSVGEFIGSCENSTVLCFGEHLGINTAVIGTYQFWVSKVVQERIFFEDKPYFRCDSEPVLFTLNINPTPSAVLKDEMPSVKLGEYFNLMDMVEENENGYWTGQNILRFGAANGQNYFYFFPKKTGLNKVFYNVQSGDCIQTQTLVINVQSYRLADGLSLFDPLIVFPNPTQGKIYVNLSNAIDVEHSIEVFDINGKLHHQQTVNNIKNTLFELDLSHLAKGVYLVETRNALEINSEKIIIE